jgi:hypothetical protein
MLMYRLKFLSFSKHIEMIKMSIINLRKHDFSQLSWEHGHQRSAWVCRTKKTWRSIDRNRLRGREVCLAHSH